MSMVRSVTVLWVVSAVPVFPRSREARRSWRPVSKGIDETHHEAACSDVGFGSLRGGAVALGESGRWPRRDLPDRVQDGVSVVRGDGEELIAHVARNLCKPRKLSSKIRQLVDLIERCRVSPFALRASVSKEPLLMCEVPQKTQSVLPSSHAQHLRRVRVDTETKCLANQHGGGA